LDFARSGTLLIAALGYLGIVWGLKRLGLPASTTSAELEDSRSLTPSIGFVRRNLARSCGLSRRSNVMIPSTYSRVPTHTRGDVNRRIRRKTEENVEYFAQHPREIDGRLRDLDREWDIERAIEMNASALAFTGVVLGATHSKRWLALPALVTAFLFQHAVQGWCPPVPILRRFGFRTAYEIDEERQALKALRGDFRAVSRKRGNGRAALKAARA
jgi:hypothetical protein